MRLNPLRVENRRLRENLRPQTRVGIGRYLILLQVERCNMDSDTDGGVEMTKMR
jgi:hypothetical protein